MMQQIRKMQQEMAQRRTSWPSRRRGDGGGRHGDGRDQRRLQGEEGHLKPEAVDPDDVETLEDLIVVALNDALGKVAELSPQDGAVTGGLKIPGLM